MLNGRLAKHYGVPGVTGLEVRRVPCRRASVRGGLLSQGAVLKVSANGTGTSPVVRGVYVLERFLGTTPPPPPPGVPAVEPDIRGATTVREQLAKHRSVETCAGCHRLIDPPGFAPGELRPDRRVAGPVPQPGGRGPPRSRRCRRARYKLGPPVDAGRRAVATAARFKDFEEFRTLLLADPDRFARCLTEKLLTFATGREAGPADRPEVARLVAGVRRPQARRPRPHPRRRPERPVPDQVTARGADPA